MKVRIHLHSYHQFVTDCAHIKDLLVVYGDQPGAVIFSFVLVHYVINHGEFIENGYVPNTSSTKDFRMGSRPYCDRGSRFLQR